MASSNLTSGFIDLATYDELEKYFYGGAKATTYFVRRTRKSSWFTQVPVLLTINGGAGDFGSENWQANISRAGDYLLQNWLRCTTPALTPAAAGTNIRWTRNFMHNLISEASIVFNDLVEARFDSVHLDFWAAFTVPAGKQGGYNNMIGNIDELVNPAPLAALPAVTLNLPLPFPHTRDSGVALPTAALPYNEMRLSFSFRNWTALLVAYSTVPGADFSRPAVIGDIAGATVPHLSNVQVWANYAIVSNAERVKMGAAPRDIAIEQVQTVPAQNAVFNGATSMSRDLRLSHAIKVLFFGMKNTTNSADHSNYTCAEPVFVGASLNYDPAAATDPIQSTSLLYENTTRLNAMGSDYFSLIQPYYQCDTFTIPEATGYHMYSYSLDLLNLDPMGSTNYGKLTNVSMTFVYSADAILGASGAGVPADGQYVTQTFSTACTAVNNNIVRVSGGALGFPVL